MIIAFILENLVDLAIVVGAILAIETLLRLLPSKKSLSLVSIIARGLARAAVLLRRAADLLPEKRK